MIRLFATITRRLLPPLAALAAVAGLWAHVAAASPPRAIVDPYTSAVIRRDTYGVPHILAETEAAAAFAHGYATAEDHFPLLARAFLRARGEQASVFGESFEREDLLIRQLGIWDIAKERFDEVPPYVRAVLDGYADGYNAWLAEHQAAAPSWAKPVTGVDVLAHCRTVLLVDFSLDLRPWRGVSLGEGAGSNMWAIGRERSKSHHGLLLANPHLDWTDRMLLHEVHLTVPGTIDVSGATLVGFPVVTIGFNSQLGWTHTVNGVRADEVDELTLDPTRPMTYVYDGVSLPIRSRFVSLQVKTANGVETRTHTILASHLGPIIRVDREKHQAYAYHSANLGLVNFLTQYNAMAKARSFDAFRTALNMQQLPTFNIGYADRTGNIFYLFNGRIPARPAGTAEWQVIHPIADLPQLINPPGGYVQNTNNAPWYTTARRLLDKSKFPPYIGGDGLPLRGQIGLRMLEASPTLTLDRMMTLRRSETMGSAIRLKAELVRLLRARTPASPDATEAARLLERWDNRASVDSRGAVLWMRWVEGYMRKASSTFRQKWTAAHPLTTPSGIGDAAAALAAMDEAIADMKRQYGTLAVRWGDVYRIRRGTLDLPIGGANDTFRATWYKSDGDRHVAVGGDTFVLAVEFTPSPTAYSVLAYSESSNPDSPHFNDQLTLFATGRFKRAWFSDAEIQQHLERSYPVHPAVQLTH